MPRLTPLRIIAQWRRYAAIAAKAARRAAPGAKIYIAGGAAEQRLTIASDIDIVVALPHEPSLQEAAELRARILEEAEKLGLPPYAPIELHIVGPQGLKRHQERGKLVELGQAALESGEEE